MSITLLSGDCRTVLPTLAANSVHTCVTSPPYYALRSYLDATHPDKHREIGSEATPDEYLATMVAVFREVRRVLRPDGTLWLNIGDSYAGGKQGRSDQDRNTRNNDGRNTANASLSGPDYGRQLPVPKGYKPKDLLMMPARLALALQADGWWVRSDIIWSKPNPMPESVTDRPTSAYEHVFLLTKSARYFYDADAVREEAEYGYQHNHSSWVSGGSNGDGHRSGGHGNAERNPSSGRNCRNVWTLPTSPYSEAHFATFPPALAERCIRAGTSERGCCAACGAPWRRTTERQDTGRTQKMPDGFNTGPGAHGSVHPLGREKGAAGVPVMASVTTGWSASCACAADVVPATVLDPFSGASTTLLVAQRLQRQAIGIELNPEYVTMGRQRIEDEAGLFADVQTLDGVPSDVEPEQPVLGFAQPDLFAEAAD